MSITDSLTLQFDITKKLIQSMDKVLSSLERSNKKSSDQSNIINCINDSLSQQQDLIDNSTNSLNDSIDNLDKALKKNDEAASQNKFMNSLTEYRKYIKDSSAKRYFFIEPMKNLKSRIINANTSLLEKIKKSKLGIIVLNKFAGLKSQFEDFSKAIENANGTLEKTMLILKGLKEVMVTTISGIATLGFGFIAKIIGSLISGVVNVIKTGTGIVLKFLKLTLTLPFQLAQIGASIGGKIRKEIVETFYQAREDAKKTFDLTSSIGEGVKKLTNITIGSLKNFEYANSNLTRLFGFGSQGAAQMMKFMIDNISAMGHFSELFGKSLMSNIESVEFLALAQKSMNMSTEDISYMALTAASNGESIYNAIDRTREALEVVSRNSGVDFKRLSTNFFKLRKDIVEFGHLSDIELSKTVSRITQLGVKTEDVTNVFKQFSTFESAAQSAAQLYQTFGMNIDAFTLISERDPAKIIEMFRQSMYETGKSFEDLNRHEKSLMTQFTGLSAESLKSVMNFRNMNFSYSELKEKMKSEDVTEKQIKSIDNLKSSISQFQKTLQFKSPFEAFFSGLTKSMSYNKEMYKELMELSNINESIYHFVLSTDKRTLRKLVAPIIDVIRVMKSVFSSKGFKKALKGGLQAISELGLSITKSVFSPKFIKEIDNLSVKFATSNIKIFKAKNKNLFNVIKGSFNDKKTGNIIRKVLLKSGTSIKKLSKMTTEEMINAVKKAAYEFGNDIESRKAMISLTKKINEAFETEFNTEKVKKAVVKQNNPVEAVNKFVTKVSNLMGENEELGSRIINIAGTLMGQIIKGSAGGGLAVVQEINKSLKAAEDLNEEKVEEGLKKKTGLKGFDWKSLKEAYNAEFININKNKNAFVKISKIVGRTFKGLANEVGNIIVSMLEEVYFSMITSDSSLAQFFAVFGKYGSYSAITGDSTKGLAYKEVEGKKDLKDNKFAKFGKTFAKKKDITQLGGSLQQLMSLTTSRYAQSKLIAHRAIFEIAKNTLSKIEKQNNNNTMFNRLKDYYLKKASDESFYDFSMNNKLKNSFTIYESEPEVHFQLVNDILKFGKNIIKDKSPNAFEKQFQEILGNLNSIITGSRKSKYDEGLKREELTKLYQESFIQDGDFSKINSDNMRIINNGTMYIPSDKDQGEFIVWKKDGAIYNMFNSIKSEFDQEINKVEATPIKVTLNNTNKKASGKQIKSIIMKLKELNEVLKNRKIKVNQTTKTENGEILT